MTTLNQEQHHKAENARRWVAESAESQSLSERGSVRPNEAVRSAENQRMGGDPLRVKSIRSWVKQGGPGRQVALILAALLIGVPIALLVLEPLLSVIVMVVIGIFMVRGLLSSGAGQGSEPGSDESDWDPWSDEDEPPHSLSIDQRNPYNW